MASRRTRPISFDVFAQRIIREYETIKARKTAEAMKRITDHVRALGVRSTSGLDREMLMRFIERRRSQEASENTIVGELGRLKRLCNLAIRDHVLEEIPFESREVLVRPVPSKKPTHLTDPQIVHLLHMLDAEVFAACELDDAPSWRKRVRKNPFLGNEWRARRLRFVVACWVFTGARKNEILFAWKEDVDREHKILTITAERRRLKTIGSHRKVPIVEQLDAYLEDWLPHSGPSVYLVPGARMQSPWQFGGPGYTPLDVVKAALERAGISGGFIHMFRDTWLTSAEARGVPEVAMQKITGITQKRTLDFYVHRNNQMLHEAVQGVRIPGLPGSQSA